MNFPHVYTLQGLKDRILANFPELLGFKDGRDILFLSNEDVGTAFWQGHMIYAHGIYAGLGVDKCLVFPCSTYSLDATQFQAHQAKGKRQPRKHQVGNMDCVSRGNKYVFLFH